MNWEDFLDPYIREKLRKRLSEDDTPPPQSNPIIRAPEMGDYPQESIRPQTTMESVKDFVTDIYPGRATMDYLATGQHSTNIVGDLAGDFAGPIGKLGALGKAAGVGIGGLVHMGGKNYKNAVLHRAIRDTELPFLDAIIKSGETTTMPTTFNAPKYPFTFSDKSYPAGIVLDAPKGSIKSMFAADAWTERIPGKVITHSDRGVPIHSLDWKATHNLDSELSPETSSLWDYLFELKRRDRDHGEIISDINRDTVKGIRLSPKTDDAWRRPYVDFAERHNLPVYYWDSSDLTRFNREKQLENIIRTKDLGRWAKSSDGSYSIPRIQPYEPEPKIIMDLTDFLKEMGWQ